MSGDLINRKALIESLSVDYYEHYSKNHSYSENDLFNLIVELIENYPTAYDVDKVIEQLEELKTYKLNMADAMSEIMRRGELGTYVCFEDVLEIVKSGGVTDE